MTGSPEAQGAMALIVKADHYGIVSGSVSAPLVSMIGTVAGVQPVAVLGDSGPPPAPITFTAEQTKLITDAVAATQQAAQTTASAAGGTPTQGNTASSDVQNAIKGLNLIGSVIDDIGKFEGGATATLHWWGWTLDLNHDASQALGRLLKSDTDDLITLLGLFLTSAPIAAAFAIVKAATTELAGWISNDDTGNGVEISFFLWIAPYVSSK